MNLLLRTSYRIIMQAAGKTFQLLFASSDLTNTFLFFDFFIAFLIFWLTEILTHYFNISMVRYCCIIINSP